MARSFYVETEVEAGDVVFQQNNPSAGWFKVVELQFSGNVTARTTTWGRDTNVNYTVTAVISPLDNPRKTETLPADALRPSAQLAEVIRGFVATHQRLFEQANTDDQRKRSQKRITEAQRLVAELFLIDPELTHGDALDLLAQGNEIFTADLAAL